MEARRTEDYLKSTWHTAIHTLGCKMGLAQFKGPCYRPDFELLFHMYIQVSFEFSGFLSRLPEYGVDVGLALLNSPLV